MHRHIDRVPIGGREIKGIPTSDWLVFREVVLDGTGTMPSGLEAADQGPESV